MSALPVILIIEDEDFLRFSLCDFLEDHGYPVFAAPNAEDGLDQLDLGHPDVCIVDMRLPDMNGNEFILRAHLFNPRLKFIIFTGSVEYTLPGSLLGIGLCSADILFKPLTDMRILVDKIRDLFSAPPSLGPAGPSFSP